MSNFYFDNQVPPYSIYNPRPIQMLMNKKGKLSFPNGSVYGGSLHKRAAHQDEVIEKKKWTPDRTYEHTAPSKMRKPKSKKLYEFISLGHNQFAHGFVPQHKKHIPLGFAIENNYIPLKHPPFLSIVYRN